MIASYAHNFGLVIVVVVVVIVHVIVMFLLIPQTFLQSLVKIGSETAEILMTMSLWWWWWWVVVWWWCKVIFVSNPTFELR